MTKNQSFLAALAAVALGATLSACGAATTGSVDGGGGAQSVAVNIQPPSAEVLPARTVQFASGVTGTADTAVTWTVVEASGGSVDANGLYTAPSSVGTYHVQVASRAEPGTVARATVTVTAAPAVQVAISPKTTSVAVGKAVTFSATVRNASNTAVTYRVQEASGCGSVTAGGVYTAPAAAATCHVVATSAADTSKSDTATVTVTATPVINVAVNPGTAAISSCLTQTFTATVTGTTDTAVTWSVVEAGGGVITSAGVYTAPASAGTYHVVATSHASASRTAQATVTVTDKILSVSVSPDPITVSPGGTVQFTATVVTTCGSTTSLQEVPVTASAQ